MRRPNPKPPEPPPRIELDTTQLNMTRRDWVDEAKRRQPGANGSDGEKPTHAQTRNWNLAMLTLLGSLVDNSAPPGYGEFLRSWSKPMADDERPVEKDPNGLVREIYEVLKRHYG